MNYYEKVESNFPEHFFSILKQYIGISKWQIPFHNIIPAVLNSTIINNVKQLFLSVVEINSHNPHVDFNCSVVDCTCKCGKLSFYWGCKRMDKIRIFL
jgi:hypothetical protein